MADTAPTLRLALLGNPNCGKTALFNLLTGSRQKVANYAGVTVERKEGSLRTPQGREVLVIDLPGAYSLNALSADEAVTRDIVTGQRADEPLPDLVVCVVDATNLKLNLRLVLEARALGLPMVLALNMGDLARQSGVEVNRETLERELGMPVVETVGVQHDGARALLEQLDHLPTKPLEAGTSGGRWHAGTVEQVMATQQAVRRIVAQAVKQPPNTLALNMGDLARQSGVEVNRETLERELGMPVVETVGVQHDGARALLEQLDHLPIKPREAATSGGRWHAGTVEQVMATQQTVRRIVAQAVKQPPNTLARDDAVDRVVLHPLWGMVLLGFTLFLMFQAVFSWAALPMELIKTGVQSLSDGIQTVLPAGPLTSLLTDGVIAGAGGVLVFLPQILVLFFFILVLEDSGYLPRAAFLLDRVMGTVGLSGRSFIPLLSSFACAVPGVMATRTITHWRDRLVTIMIAPLMTCSARLPVYALLISAFIPSRTVGGLFNLQGLVMFGLYLGGIVSAMVVAGVFMLWRGHARPTPLIMELPTYRWPSPRNLAHGLYERALIFVRRVGGILLALMILLWFLSSYPGAPEGATGPAIQYSFAGTIGHWLQPLVAPIGFNWQIAIALVPGMAAREVAVGALGTVYALSATGGDTEAQLGGLIAQSWSLATALSLLVWYVFAPQCISTLVAVKRETNGWRYPVLMTVYLFALAYGASFVTYRVALAMGGGS